MARDSHWKDDGQGSYQRIEGDFEAGVDFHPEKKAWIAWITRMLHERTQLEDLLRLNRSHASSVRMHAIHTGPALDSAAKAMAYADDYIARIVAAEAAAPRTMITPAPMRSPAEERKAIVAYLRRIADDEPQSVGETLRSLARRIEQGVHVTER